jgi:hypothetical protein
VFRSVYRMHTENIPYWYIFHIGILALLSPQFCFSGSIAKLGST